VRSGLLRLTMTQRKTDDGFGGLGPVVGRVLRWLPGWVLILVAGVWPFPTAKGFIASVRPWAFGRSTGWWVDLFNTSTWTLEPYRIALDSSANGSFVENMVNSFAIAIPATLTPLLIGSAAAYAIVWIPFRGSGALFFGIVALIAVRSSACCYQFCRHSCRGCISPCRSSTSQSRWCR
jgi:ABC-type glycerol-3-phosphate transport system permease component